MERIMSVSKFVGKRVHKYYWEDNFDCAETTLKILSECFQLPLNKQVIDSALGLPGAGQNGETCGIVSGNVMFIGIIGKANKIEHSVIKIGCKQFAKQFKSTFGSLQCGVLRPEGFHPDNPPHLCEKLTCEGILFCINFVAKFAKTQK